MMIVPLVGARVMMRHLIAHDVGGNGVHGMRAKRLQLKRSHSKAFVSNENVRSLTPTCSYRSSSFIFYRIVLLPTFRSMHLKAFEDFESNAMRLLSDDASRVIYAPLIYHYIFSVGTMLARWTHFICPRRD